MLGALFLVAVVASTLAVGRVMHKRDQVYRNQLSDQQKRGLGQMVEELRKYAPRDDL